MINITDLNLSSEKTYRECSINGVTIQVLQYLPIKEKMDLIEVVVEESMGDGYCNPLSVDVLLHTYIVLSYTDIKLSEEQNMLSVYDLLESNGVIDTVVSFIPKVEYDNLVTSTYSCIEMIEKSGNSPLNIIRDGINKTLNMINEAKDAVSTIDFNSDNVKNVLAIAKDNGAI